MPIWNAYGDGGGGTTTINETIPIFANGLVVHNEGGFSAAPLIAQFPVRIRHQDGITGTPLIGAAPGLHLVGKLIGANLNVTTDQLIPLYGAEEMVVDRIIVCHASAAAGGTIAGGIYTLPAKAGTAIVAAAQSWTTLAVPPAILDLTVVRAAGGLDQLYLSLTTANGAALTADVYVFALALSVDPDVP